MNRSINVGLFGLGTVGRGVYQLLSRENEVFKKRLGAEINIKRVLVRDPKKERGVDLPAGVLTTDAQDILGDPDIQIVVEVMGGVGEAKDLVLKALAAGKHVVTANKELMANYGHEVFAAAQSQGVDVLFEASVAGGIPIILPLKDSLVGNRILRVMGIVNGTTNYILSQMERGRDYAEALAQAQSLGYAERDPSSDIEGHDAAAKIAILASIAFNSRVTAGQVHTEGIGSVTVEDINYARELGYVIKLLAVAKVEGERLDVRVHPTMIPLSHPLASVKDVYNAIFVEGDAVGDLMFYGQGAGSLPTASAVVADLFLAAEHLGREARGVYTCTCFHSLEVEPIDQVSGCFYLLIECEDHPGVLAKIARIFGDYQVGLGSVIQKGATDGVAEVVFMTHQVVEGDLRAALKEISALEPVSNVRNVIRVEGEAG